MSDDKATESHDGKPLLGLGLNEGLGPNAQDVDRDPTHAWTLAQRCELAEKCLPVSRFRAQVERLHADMLAELARLTAALRKANDQAEHFERGWYLRGDALETALEDLGQATSFASKKARDRHAKTLDTLRAALGPNV